MISKPPPRPAASLAQHFHIRMRGNAPPPMCGRCPNAQEKADGACFCALLKRAIQMSKPECTATEWKRSLGLL